MDAAKRFREAPRSARVAVAAVGAIGLLAVVSEFGWPASGLAAIGTGAWFVWSDRDRLPRLLGLLVALDGMGSLYRHTTWGEPTSRVMSQLLLAVLLAMGVVLLVSRREKRAPVPAPE